MRTGQLKTKGKGGGEGVHEACVCPPTIKIHSIKTFFSFFFFFFYKIMALLPNTFHKSMPQPNVSIKVFVCMTNGSAWNCHFERIRFFSLSLPLL